MDKYEKFLSRYETKAVPWDHELPPPELIELAEKMPAGRALDLGCGYGRSARYLAEKGWMADGVEFVELAVEEANRRLGDAPYADRVRIFHGSVTEMPFLTPPYDLIVDIGCMHSLSEPSLQQYKSELLRLLKPSGTYLLFAHVNDGEESTEDEAPKGIPLQTIYTLFDQFTPERVEHGQTQVEDKPPWNSAWFWFTKA